LEISQQTLSQHEEVLRLIFDKDKEKLRKLLEMHIVDKDNEENQMKSKYPDLFTGISMTNLPKQKIWEKDFLTSV